jgi:hypothetical protein
LDFKSSKNETLSLQLAAENSHLRSFEPSIWAIKGWVDDSETKAYNNAIEDWVEYKSAIVKEYIPTLTPHINLLEIVKFLKDQLKLNKPFERCQS